MASWSRAGLAGLLLGAALPCSPALAGKADDTFTWATSGEIGSADAYYAPQAEAIWASLANCDMLIWRDVKTGAYRPLLAKSWTWTDPVTLDVTLRTDVKFHDGRPFGPEDVAYTLNFVKDPAHGVGLRIVADWIDRAEVTGPDSVRIHAKGPTPQALELLSGMLPIYPKGHYDAAPAVAAADGKTRRDYGAVLPMCTGPYKLASYRPGQTLTLVRNDNYFADSPKGRPRIGKLVFRVIPDLDTQVAALLTGEIDWMWGVPPENAKQLAAMPEVTVKSAGSIRFAFLSFDVAGRSGDSPLKDVRVRRAFFYAVDRATIAREFVGAGAQAVKALCSPLQVGCAQDVPDYPYDPAKARALLAEAGYPNGITAPFYAYRDQPYAEAVIDYLRKAGINAELHFLQFPAFSPLSSAGKLPLRDISWGSSGILDVAASTSFYFEGTADDYARDPDVVRWLKQGDTTAAPERLEAYRKALARINEQALAMPLYSYGRTYAFSKDFDYPVTEDDQNHFYLGRWK